MLVFLNVLLTIQQSGNRTLAEAKAEPWMANLERLRLFPQLNPEHLENLIFVTRNKYENIFVQEAFS